MKYDMKFWTGSLLCIVDVVVLGLGIWLLTVGLGLLGGGTGEGGISIIVEQIGEISNVNGRLVVFLSGLALVLASLGYARKAYQEAKTLERGFVDTVRHFSPL